MMDLESEVMRGPGSIPTGSNIFYWKLREGNVFSHVCLFTWVPHVTITHDALYRIPHHYTWDSTVHASLNELLFAVAPCEQAFKN